MNYGSQTQNASQAISSYGSRREPVEYICGGAPDFSYHVEAQLTSSLSHIYFEQYFDPCFTHTELMTLGWNDIYRDAFDDNGCFRVRANTRTFATLHTLADCTAVNEMSSKDAVRCRECGHRILYKKRTKRSASSFTKGEVRVC